MAAKAIMIQGTMSNAGKSVLTAGLCRIFRQDGYSVAPFKSQNMALNSFVTREGLEMGRAQVMQAEAAGVEPSVRMNPILLKPSSDMGSQVIVNGEVLGDMRASDYFRHKKELVPQILASCRSLAEELLEEIGHSHGGDEAHHHHHHEHHDGEGCSCGHDHHDHEHHDEHDHHGHDHCHDEAACDVCLGHEHGHEHHHDHDEAACDACCGHHHHHGHDADEVFTSWGRETPRKYSREDLQDALSALAMSEDYGYILRAKGMVPCDDGQTWLHFDLVPEEFQIREGAADYTGRLCVIGSGLDEAGLEKLFQLV